MKDREDLLKLCIKGLNEKNIIDDKRYKDRLKKEIKEIDAQGEHVYFLNLYKDFNNKKLIFPYNQHNLLVVWLLGLANDFDIEKDYAWAQGEFPDIDIDYLKDIRDYLKRTWAADTFGQEYICEIGTYGTSGIKSASLDMARVYDADKDVLQQITNKMADRDDDGNELDWDKALEMHPDFKSYCEKHPEVSDAAQQLLDRIRTGGVHAGGLIVADRRLDGFVPLEVRMVNKDNPNGVICSAWTEGLNRQDLGPVGLIKFDLLVISNLMQIALACKLIKERHGLEKICALPGQWNFSDISYLNDPKSIEMADRGDLKCIFQFDSDGIRKLVKRGGVSNFDDLAAYSAIYRPGPLNMSMDVHYCKRKRGEEPYEIHPLMQKSLGKTYGILVYQEQILDILRVVGKIPDMHTEKVRKAISKKKVKDFIKYKEMFIDNGQKTLQESEEFVSNLWDQVESFAEYGFNKSMHHDTIIDCVDGSKQIKHIRAGDKVYCINEKGERAETEVVAVHDHGVIDVVEATFDDGYSVKCTLDHKFLTKEGQVPLWKIIQDNLVVLSSPFKIEQKRPQFKLCSTQRPDTQRGVFEETRYNAFEVEHDLFSQKNRRNEERKFGSVPDYAPISDTGNLVHRRVLRIVPVGKRQCYDLEVDVSTHNFILPNGVVTSNSHSYAYTYISARLLWLKAHYPLEFYAAILMCETDTDKFKEYKIDAEKHGIEICPVHINKSKKNFVIEDGKIYFGFSNIKTIGEEVADRIVANQPYADISDFLEKFGTDTIPIKALTSLGVFEENHDRITMRKFSEYYKKQANSRRDRRKRFEQSLENKNQDLKELIKQEIEEDDPMFDKLCNFTQDSFDACVKVFDGINKDVEYKNKGEIKIKKVPFIKLIQDLFNKRQASIDSFNKKEKEDDEFKITIEEFNSSLISLDKEEEKILKEELVINGKKSYPLAESMYYGFQWTHVLETCPEYAGNTIDKFLESCDIGNIKNKFIEVQINKVKKRTSKKGTEFYSVEVEDANGKNAVINVWQEDFTRFREDFFVGNLVCLEVNPPSGGFNTFTFKSYPKHLKKTMPDKEADVRLYVLKRPQISNEKDLSNNLQEDNYHIFK